MGDGRAKRPGGCGNVRNETATTGTAAGDAEPRRTGAGGGPGSGARLPPSEAGALGAASGASGAAGEAGLPFVAVLAVPPDPGAGAGGDVVGSEGSVAGGVPLGGEVPVRGGSLPGAVRATDASNAAVRGSGPLVALAAAPPHRLAGAGQQVGGGEIAVAGGMPLGGEGGVEPGSGPGSVASRRSRGSLPRRPAVAGSPSSRDRAGSATTRHDHCPG